ncbi:MAG: STAS domain-containing protein [Verrucomicrobiales bacterium]|nr:STAS domain-containing protein [Verrucomicrobiales bacterium]
MSSDTSIFVGSLNDIAWVRIDGVATKDTSSCIRSFFSDRFAQGLRKFIIDLKDCQLIDSTFIGILTMLAGNVTAEGECGEVKVIHPNERNVKSICKLGLDNLITIDCGGEESKDLETLIASSLDRLESEDIDKIEKSTMILDAHETICSANEKNRQEFGDVLTYLREDLDRATKD